MKEAGSERPSPLTIEEMAKASKKAAQKTTAEIWKLRGASNHSGTVNKTALRKANKDNETPMTTGILRPKL